MGSIDAACIAGFLCRLCSEMHRTVIHIYGNQGQKHGLAEKINEYLPVTITPLDPLPKTICETCMTRVEQHHDLMLRIAKTRRLRGQITLLRNSLTQTDQISQPPPIEIVATRYEIADYNEEGAGVVRGISSGAMIIPPNSSSSSSSSTTISNSTNSSDNRLEETTSNSTTVVEPIVVQSESVNNDNVSNLSNNNIVTTSNTTEEQHQINEIINENL